MKTSEVMKKITSKEQLINFLNMVKPKANVDGQNSLDLIIKSVKDRIFTLADAKNEALKTLDEIDGEYFDTKVNKTVLFENSLKSTKKTKTVKRVNKSKKDDDDIVATDEEAEQLLNAMASKTKKQPTEKEILDAQKVFELCGYRYTYPVFPETFESEIAEGKIFVRYDENDIKKAYEAYENTDEDVQLACVMYFPEYERDYDIDPHFALGVDANKSTLLKAFGGKYPQNLDIQSIVSFSADTRILVSVSEFTGIPYATSCNKKWFTTNETLHCRVTQNGLDYQLYKVYDKGNYKK